MRVQQTVEVQGDDLVLVLSTPAGKVLARRVWQGAAKYLRQDSIKGWHKLMIPKSAGLDIQR